MYVAYTEIIKQTDKAILIRFLEHTTWIPLKHAKIYKNKIAVPDWLHKILIWTEDVNYNDEES